MGQDQHRVSQVYLRQFGFPLEAPTHISALPLHERGRMHELGRRWVKRLPIKSCTVTVDEFDLVDDDSSLAKLLEDNFGKVETNYPSVIQAISNGQYTDEAHGWVSQLMITLIIRSRRFREIIDHHIRQPYAREFLRDMCRWMEPEEGEATVRKIESISIERRLNHACVAVWHHLSYKLSQFQGVIVRDFGGRCWNTSDDPVILRHAWGEATILPAATEIYFPLSREFCLFMYHPRATYALNPLRDFKDGAFVQAGQWLHFMIQEYVLEHGAEFIFFPREVIIQEAIPPDERILRYRSEAM